MNWMQGRFKGTPKSDGKHCVNTIYYNGFLVFDMWLNHPNKILCTVGLPRKEDKGCSMGYCIPQSWTSPLHGSRLGKDCTFSKHTGNGDQQGQYTGWWFWIFLIFPYIYIIIYIYIGKNHPNWLIFFRGVETTYQKRSNEEFSFLTFWHCFWVWKGLVQNLY